MEGKILFVDDDQNILAAYRRNLRRDFEIHTAQGGELALARLAADGPFAVVVADMRMPGMDGIEVLRRIREQSPDTVRMMLTGNLDLRTAQDAVNHGHIFRLLTKPCSPEALAQALQDGLGQYRLVCTERDLLEQTLAGTVKVLTEMLSAADPVTFGLAARAADLAEEVGRRMGLAETWALRVATLLAPIGLVTLPPALLDRHRRGAALAPRELHLLAGVPEAGARLLAGIPRLEEVARIIRRQEPGPDPDGSPVQARILRAAMAFVRIRCGRVPARLALARLATGEASQDPEVLAVLGEMFPADGTGGEVPEVRRVGLAGLRIGQVLAGPVLDGDGREILPEGTPLAFTHLEKIHNHARLAGVREPIPVFDLPG
jgi:response regulator RpfG family c-di-GMP phosphodiesterase